ncbi:unnamed protein product, partial [Closterium sp. NIES-54]
VVTLEPSAAVHRPFSIKHSCLPCSTLPSYLPVIAIPSLPLSWHQLEELLSCLGSSLHVIQINAADVASDSWQGERREVAVAGMAEEAERALQKGRDVVIMTSRELITGS